VNTRATDDLLRRTDETRKKVPHSWRDEDARSELEFLWGGAVTPDGVFVKSSEEVLYDGDGCRVSIVIGTARGSYAFGCGYQTPTRGFGFAPSLSGELFASHGGARAAAMNRLFHRLPTPLHQHGERERKRMERMRRALAEPPRRPSPF